MKRYNAKSLRASLRNLVISSSLARLPRCRRLLAMTTGLIFVFTAIIGCDFRVARDYRQLVYHILTEPPTLNPMVATDAVSNRIETFIFDNLVQMDNVTLEYKPMLAKSWKISDDHLEYTFYLRDDVYWHDGVKMTADDVIYSYDRIQDPKVDAAPLRVYFRDVKKAEKIDDYTVKFTYAEQYFRAFEIVGGLPILPRHIFDDGTDFNKNPAGRVPVGNGPFKFKEWVTGSKVVLEKNENYWGEVPKIEGITFQIITDMSVALQVLKKGQIDVAGLSSIQWVKQTESRNFNNRFDKYKYYLPQYSFIAWNQNRPFFKDRRVRRAMTMMIDRDKIREKLYYNLPEIVTGNFYKFGPAYNQDIKHLKYNPEEAMRLLDEAGWKDRDGDGIREKDGVPFRFTFMSSGSQTAERTTNILRENLKKIGIDMDVSKFEWTVFSKNLNDRAFDATMLGWSMPLEADPYQLWHSSQAEKGSNFIGFKNAEADQIIESARREFDPSIRRKMYWRFHEIMHDEQPYTFMFMTPSLIAVQKRFTGVKVYKLGLDIREWSVRQPTMKLYQ